MLSGRYRALDLTDVRGAYCGKLLADLGMDVIKVEPPDGSSERSLPPFYHDQQQREGGLYWLGFNVGKRGITLDLRSDEGRDLFLRLVDGADFVLESFPSRYLAELGIDCTTLRERKPSLIFTSITPFGQSGPYAKFAASDLTILALGGIMNITGDADRAPLRFSIEQSFLQAGAQAAAATLIAQHHRAATGRGQHVDVSMQEAILQVNWLQQHFWDVEHSLTRREGRRSSRGPVFLRIVFPCLDGYISWRIFVSAMGRMTRALADWMVEEGDGGTVAQVGWEVLGMDEMRQEEVDIWEGEFSAFFLKHTKNRLFAEALKRGLPLFPVNDPKDLLQDPQLAARHFWKEVAHPELGGEVTFPGDPFHSSVQGTRKKLRAPLLGEHNTQVYGDLGLSNDDLARLARAGVI